MMRPERATALEEFCPLGRSRTNIAKHTELEKLQYIIITKLQSNKNEKENELQQL